jgi:electron transfer flavoprotein alpha subunit
MIAVIPVRAGVLPAGAQEAVAEAGWRSIVIGTGTESAAAGLGGNVALCELAGYAPAAASAALAALPNADLDDVVVLPASADGRDLAPRLAHRLGVPLYAGAIEVTPARVELARYGGLVIQTVRPSGPFVATLQPGVRGLESATPALRSRVLHFQPSPDDAADAATLELLPADPSTVDLSEAPRIVGGGAGLDAPERFEQLARFAERLGASVGATRVITDRRWIGHERQIGTTGVVVNPELYLAFGISGAVQHTSGLGSPRHIISVNTDPHCPMMQLADLAIVADANAVLDALEAALHD